MKKKLKAFILHPIWHLDIRTIWKVIRDWDDGKLHTTEDAELLHAEIERGELRAQFKHPYAVKLMALSFADTLAQCPAAKNYVEIGLRHTAHGDFTVRLQKADGKTPHQLREEAERKLNEIWGVLNAVRVAVKFGRAQEIADLLPRIEEVLEKP